MLEVEIGIELYYEFDIFAHEVGPSITQEGNLFSNPRLVHSFTGLCNNTAAIATEHESIIFVYVVHYAIVRIDS